MMLVESWQQLEVILVYFLASLASLFSSLFLDGSKTIPVGGKVAKD
jgi:hypothetical protein